MSQHLDSTCSAASASKRLPDVGSKKRVRLHIPEAITKYVFTVSHSLQVTLVRHGQSTWNKEGRIQGSSDLSVLTQKGESQAEITREMLQVSPNSSQQRSPDVDTLYFFRKAMEMTASVVPLLVQVELPKSYGIHGNQSSSICGSYGKLICSLQGLLKEEGKAKYGDKYRRHGRQTLQTLKFDGHFPVRELWERGAEC